jgi:hypothetical protein
MPLPLGSWQDTRGADGEVLAGVIEVGLTGSYQWGSSVRFLAGYDVLLVSGLALAPDQLDFSADPENGQYLNDSGNTVYHGPHGGVEIVW